MRPARHDIRLARFTLCLAAFRSYTWRVDAMKAAVTLATVTVLLASLATAAAQTPSPPASQQPESQRPIRMPADLPPAVDEAMRVEAQDLDTVLADSNVVLLDVREPWELEAFGTRKGYINIPLGELEKRLDELPKDKLILTAGAVNDIETPRVQ